MNRRQLFTRLSAIALAPLVKWLPKEELYPPGEVLPVLTAYTSDKGLGVITIVHSGAYVFYDKNGTATIGFKPVPQEEA